MRTLAILSALVILALSATIADAGPFQRLRDRRAERRQGSQQCQPQTAPTSPLTYVPGESMPEPAAFGIALPTFSAAGCSNGQCGVTRGFRR